MVRTVTLEGWAWMEACWNKQQQECAAHRASSSLCSSLVSSLVSSLGSSPAQQRTSLINSREEAAWRNRVWCRRRQQPRLRWLPVGAVCGSDRQVLTFSPPAHLEPLPHPPPPHCRAEDLQRAVVD